MADPYPKKILPDLEGKIGELRMMRFWSKVDVRGPDECWEWQASINTSGYGRFKLVSHQMVTASRVALIGNSQTEPEGLHVLHTCDNRRCCNPNHLYFGTVAQNNQDKVDRGRATTGNQVCEHNGAAKLTEEQVVQIVERFRRGMNNKQIASDLPVTHQMVSKIRRGHMWRPVTERLGWSPAQPYRSGEAPTRLNAEGADRGR